MDRPYSSLERVSLRGSVLNLALELGFMNKTSEVADWMFGPFPEVELESPAMEEQQDEVPASPVSGHQDHSVPVSHAEAHAPLPCENSSSNTARKFHSIRRLPGIANVKAGIVNSSYKVRRIARPSGGLTRLPSRMKSISKLRLSRRQRPAAPATPDTQFAPMDMAFTSRAPVPMIGVTEDSPSPDRRRMKRLKPRTFLRPLSLFSVTGSPTAHPSTLASLPITPFVLVTPMNESYLQDGPATPFNRHSFVIVSKDDTSSFEDGAPLWDDALSQTTYRSRRLVPPSLVRMWRKTVFVRSTTESPTETASEAETASLGGDFRRSSTSESAASIPADLHDIHMRPSDTSFYNQPSFPSIKRGCDIPFPVLPVLPVPLSDLRTERHVPAAPFYETRDEGCSNRLTGAFFEDIEEGYDTESVYSSD